MASWLRNTRNYRWENSNQDKYNSEIVEVEAESEKLKEEMAKNSSKHLDEKVTELEIENEDLERQIWISESIITDLEQKLDSSLEEIALL